MVTTKNNKISSQTKPATAGRLRITLDETVPVKDERPIARLHKLFQGFRQQYSRKGAVKR